MARTAGTSSRDEVSGLLARMDVVDPLVNAVCTRHPDALEQADRLDREAAEGRARGPLHGRAVLVKDNIDTHDLATTAGSLALADVPAPARDATLVARLRDAGLVILGKTNRRSGPTSATSRRRRDGAGTAA